jgi:hypothetical protein
MVSDPRSQIPSPLLLAGQEDRDGRGALGRALSITDRHKLAN